MAVPRKSLAVRSRPATKQLRRQQLIDATIGSIAKRGFAETTLARVAEEAGMSRGIVNFHFETKDALLEETLQQLAEEYQQTWQRAVRKAGLDPAARLQALLLADFDPLVFTRKKVAVWLAFVGEARSRPTYLAICGARDRDRYEEIRANCEATVSRGTANGRDSEAIAAGLAALGDGFYVDFLLAPKDFSRDKAERTVRLYLEALFPRDFPLSGA